MTTIALGEQGVLRVFAVDLPEAAVAEVLALDPVSGHPTAFNRALVPDIPLDPDFIEAFPVSQLHQYGHDGLLSYLKRSPIKPSDLSHSAKALGAESGWVVLIWSDAFGARAATLRAAPPIRAVATLRMTSPAPRERPTERLWVAPRPQRKPRTLSPPSDTVRKRNALTGLALIAMVLIAFGLVYIGVPQ